MQLSECCRPARPVLSGKVRECKPHMCTRSFKAIFLQIANAQLLDFSIFMLKDPFHNSTAALHKLFVRCFTKNVIPCVIQSLKGQFPQNENCHVVPNLYDKRRHFESMDRKKNTENFFINILFLCWGEFHFGGNCPFRSLLYLLALFMLMFVGMRVAVDIFCPAQGWEDRYDLRKAFPLLCSKAQRAFLLLSSPLLTPGRPYQSTGLSCDL